jgi:hypothetical protein
MCLLLYSTDFQIFFPFHSDPQVTITLEQFKNQTHVCANILIKNNLGYHLLQLQLINHSVYKYIYYVLQEITH